MHGVFGEAGVHWRLEVSSVIGVELPIVPYLPLPPVFPIMLQAAGVAVEPVVGAAPPVTEVVGVRGPDGPPTIGGPLGKTTCPLIILPCFRKVTLGLSGAHILDKPQSPNMVILVFDIDFS